ncbi:MAG: hypothetical protein ABH857_01500 [Elusimicrobiota bacterium]
MNEGMYESNPEFVQSFINLLESLEESYRYQILMQIEEIFFERFSIRKYNEKNLAVFFNEIHIAIVRNTQISPLKHPDREQRLILTRLFFELNIKLSKYNKQFLLCHHTVISPCKSNLNSLKRIVGKSNNLYRYLEYITWRYENSYLPYHSDDVLLNEYNNYVLNSLERIAGFDKSLVRNYLYRNDDYRKYLKLIKKDIDLVIAYLKRYGINKTELDIINSVPGLGTLLRSNNTYTTKSRYGKSYIYHFYLNGMLVRKEYSAETANTTITDIEVCKHSLLESIDSCRLFKDYGKLLKELDNSSFKISSLFNNNDSKTRCFIYTILHTLYETNQHDFLLTDLKNVICSA